MPYSIVLQRVVTGVESIKIDDIHTDYQKFNKNKLFFKQIYDFIFTHEFIYQKLMSELLVALVEISH